MRHNPRLNRIDNGLLRRPRVWVYMQTGHTRPMNTIGYAVKSAGLRKYPLGEGIGHYHVGLGERMVIP